jgi:hypothetical protein
LSKNTKVYRFIVFIALLRASLVNTWTETLFTYHLTTS